MIDIYDYFSNHPTGARGRSVAVLRAVDTLSVSYRSSAVFAASSKGWYNALALMTEVWRSVELFISFCNNKVEVRNRWRAPRDISWVNPYSNRGTILGILPSLKEEVLKESKGCIPLCQWFLSLYHGLLPSIVRVFLSAEMEILSWSIVARPEIFPTAKNVGVIREA